jgi:hypothetical protein
MREAAEAISADPNVFATLTGTVFEVRQGYKSKDSKRQNADIANAATAYTKAYLPCAVILSTQIVGYGDVGNYGSKLVPPPHLDRLARDGVRFTNGYVTASICSPSRD